MHLCPVITLESRSFRIKSCSRIRFAAPRSEATDFHAAFDSKSIIAFSIYVKYSHCSNVPRQFPAVQSKKLPPRMILSGSFILDCRFALLTLIGTVQECDNLRSGAFQENQFVQHILTELLAGHFKEHISCCHFPVLPPVRRVPGGKRRSRSSPGGRGRIHGKVRWNAGSRPVS